MHCEHKTEAELDLCNRCTAYARIARDAKALVESRKVYVSKLLTPHDGMEQALAVMTEKLARLEDSVKFADLAKLWD